MKNIEWIRTLNSQELAYFFYVFWRKEQCRWNDSYGGLIWWLEQERDEESNELKYFIPKK